MSKSERIKLDNRLRLLIENGVKTNQRSIVALVGEQGRNQVVHIHNILSKANVKGRPSVLWCYKKELGFSTHRKKRMKQLQRQMKSGTMEVNESDPFELFICATEIRWTYYKDTQKILGKTYDMLVLQDFEALTPNLLARTVETIAGGGLVIFLLKSQQSLKQLYTLTMDVHARYRTEAHAHIKPRFNERFIISLRNCENAVFLDDRWNILNICSSAVLNVKPLGKPEISDEAVNLAQIKDEMADTPPMGAVLALTRTFDQANAVLKFVDVIADKKFATTVSLTAGRGRGKSAALGLSVALAVAYGYSNIFITSPSPENLTTVFEFILMGLDALKYDKNNDYDIIQSNQEELKKCIVRINLMRDHRQTIQYIAPEDHKMLAQAELLVIDEAAAIPLPIVRNLLGPYLVFMSSTINGYEGTGRSLSLKLLDSLRKESTVAGASRQLEEITLDESIRYAPSCPVEKWLNQLLCLDAQLPKAICTLPSPNQCQMYWINRDVLFSGNQSSEAFLAQLMSLYVASHYKNQPNDLQLLSDAPAHHLFVLCAPIKPDQSQLPLPLVVVQVAHEGRLAKESIKSALRQGDKRHGDMIPWLVSEQFRQMDFGELNGARIVRIATHPDFLRAGYGKEALRQLEAYYKGDIPLKADYVEPDEIKEVEDTSSLLTETIEPKKEMAIMCPLDGRKAERLDWLGVAFGLTHQLLSFWNKAGYRPIYIRQTANETTGEHSSVFLKTLTQGSTYVDEYAADFTKRFSSLLAFDFAKFLPGTALQILDWRDSNSRGGVDLKQHFSAYDLERVNLYTKGVVDYHLIIDVLPSLIRLCATGQINVTGLSALQKTILVSLALQHRSVDALAETWLTPKMAPMPASQLLGHFKRAMIKINDEVRRMQRNKVAEAMNVDGRTPDELNIVEDAEGDVDMVLDEEGEKVKEQEQLERSKLEKELQQYRIKGDDKEWSHELETKKNVANISIGRERSKKGGGGAENGTSNEKRKIKGGGKNAPKMKKYKT